MQNGLFNAESKPCNHQLILSNILKLIEHHRLKTDPLFLSVWGDKKYTLRSDSPNTQLIADLSFNQKDYLLLRKLMRVALRIRN